MKKFTISAIIILAFIFLSDVSLLAQVTPDNWTGDSDIDTYQETTEVYSGSSSCKIDVNSGTQGNCDLSNSVEISVTEGDSYKFSFWAYTSEFVRISGVLDWVGASSTYSNSYVGPATGGWAQFTFEGTVPPGVTGVNLRLRCYDVSGFNAPETQYVDDVEFESPTGTSLTVANGGFESWPAASSITSSYAISATEIDVEYGTSMSSVNASDYTLTGTSTITFSNASIDGTNDNIVHLSGASEDMTGDITLDNIADAANSTDLDFYAGIMPVAYVNTTNPGGTMNDVNVATFQGIISANDNYNNVWVSDAEGAYNGVMIFSYSFDGLVAVGDEILFIANRATYNSLSELVNPELLSTLSTGNSPYGPSVIDGSDIEETIAADTDPGEKWEGQLVTINDFTVDSYDDYYYRCSWSDGTTTYYFYVGDNVVYQLSGVSMTVGSTYASITGVVDWYNSGPYYRINPREQADIVGITTDARIVGSFQGWNTTDPEYVMSVNANNLMELTKNVAAGDHFYKVLEGDTWEDESFPPSDEPLNLSQDEDITWKANLETNLVIHALPNVSGDFLSELGGTDWSADDPLAEMEDPDGDEVYTLEVMLPAGDYECKVTLNKNWNQNTGDNTPFSADGYNTTTFTYDFINNTTTVSVPPSPYITVTAPNGGESIQQGDDFEITWEYAFWDGPIQIDLVNGDDELTLVYNIPVSDTSYTWGVFENQEIRDDYTIRISGINSGDPTDESDDYFSIIEPYIMPQIVISEIMYNPPESGNDSLEFLEFYNKGDEAVDFEGFFMSQGVEHIFPNIVLEPDTFLLLSIDSLAFFATFGIESFQWTSGALSNGGEPVELSDQFGNIINTVPYDDQLPWDTLADGFGPSLELLNPELDNSIAESWMHSVNFMAVNSANDSIWASPGFGFAELSSAFEANETIVLVGDSVMFTDLSTGTPTSWMWTFEGGTPGTYDGEMPPYIAYEVSGRWDVTLVVSDGDDTDSLTYEEYIWSGMMPVSDFEAEETIVVVGNYTNFMSMATGDSITYQWTFEGGTPETSSDENPAEIYYNINEWTTYDVTLVVSNLFGSDTLTKADYIEVVPVGISDPVFDEQSISLYPNPTSGKIVLAVPDNISAEYKILDINGRIVHNGNVSGTSNINLSELNNGIYFMKLVDTETQRVVVKRILIK